MKSTIQSYDKAINEILCHKVLMHNYAERLNDGFRRINAGKEYSYKQRRKRVLTNFFEFCEREDYIINTGVDVALCYSSWQEHHFSGTNKLAPTTLISDALALWGVLTKLRHPSVNALPVGSNIPKPRKLRELVYSDVSRSSSKLLGGFKLPSNTSNQSLTFTLETDVDSFIKNLVETMRLHRDIIYKVSVKYMNDANERRNFATDAAARIDASKFEDNPELLHPLQRAKGSGQHLSIFSSALEEGECGKSNLMAYITHCHNGLINRNFIGANNHLYRFTKHQYELREFFGLSSLSAVAASNIMIVEAGINVDSLRKLEVSAHGNTNNFFEPRANGYNISYHKPRANSKAYKSRNLKRTQTPSIVRNSTHDTTSLRIISIEPNSSFHIESAVNYLSDATAHHRSMLEGKLKRKLFIHDSTSNTGKPQAISDFPFKHGFKRLLVAARDYIIEDPDWCKGVSVDDIDMVLAQAPNAKKLRATEGVIRWFDSGGNPVVAAK